MMKFATKLTKETLINQVETNILYASCNVAKNKYEANTCLDVALEALDELYYEFPEVETSNYIQEIERIETFLW